MFMHKRAVYGTWFLSALTLLSISIAGCGRETISVPDTTPPHVLSTVPSLGAAGVALGAPVSVIFSKPVNCSTLTTSTFMVTSGGSAIGGAVTCSGSTATFTPSSVLVLHTLYTGLITTGVTDLVGNVMVQNYSWNFEAVAGPSVLSTTPITSTPGPTGVAFNQVISATFLQLPTLDPDSAGAALNCSTLTATTFTVTAPAPIGTLGGTVTCSGATATFTPTAPLAAGITYTAALSPGVQDIAGTGLATGYSWSFSTDTLPTVLATTPANSATGILLNQAIGVTFSKAMTCSTLYSPATAFTVTGPGTTTVAGAVSCTGNGAIFVPSNLLATNTLYTATISTGALDAQGEPLAGNYSWNFRTVPAPTVPAVIATNPAAGATGVPTNQAIAATFNEAMNPATINTITFTLKATLSGAAVTGIVSYDVSGSVATFTPTAPSPLAINTSYSATITTGAQDLAGNVMTGNYVWTFTTGAAPNTTKPTVISTIPTPSGITGVPTNQTVSATFSEAMNPLTISGTTFTLTAAPGATAVAGLVTYAGIGNTATFTPTAALTTGITYTATITTGVQDLSGNALASNYSWTFTVGAANTTAPTITLTSPVNGATSVAINQTVSATFSKAMNPLSINTTTFTLTGPSGTAVIGTISYNAATFIATFTPTSNLVSNTIYTADITTGVTDSTGNSLGSGAAPNPWSFTTVGVVGSVPVTLGTAALFGDVGGTAGMTNSGNLTVINGNIATTGVSTLVVDMHDNSVVVGGVDECSYSETPIDTGGLVNGTIYTAPGTSIPTVACPNEGTAVTSAIAAKAEADALVAYNQLVAFPNGQAVETCAGCGGGNAGELGNRTLPPGIYKSTPGFYNISQGPLTLDAQGNPNAFWVFQMGTYLTVGTPTANQSIVLVNGAKASNVFWQVGSFATINGILGGGTFNGTVISQTGASVSTAGVAQVTTINGRVISLVGSVTIVNTVINVQ